VKIKQFLIEKSNVIRQIILICLFVIFITVLWAIPLYIPKSPEKSYNSKLKVDRSKIIIAIDIGHSKKAVGAISSRGYEEFYFNLSIAKLLHKELLRQGYTKSFLINEAGESVCLTERVQMAEQSLANLFISIHHDSVQPHYLESWDFKGKQRLYCDLYAGYSLFYSQKNKEANKSFIFATLLGRVLRNNEFIPTLHHAEPIKGENRALIDKYLGVYQVDDFTVIKIPKMPAILIECGIIVNRDEEILLTNPVYKKMLVTSIVTAIEVAYRDRFFQ